MEEELLFLDKNRTKEFWLFLKTELAKKAGMSDLDDLVSSDDLANALATALASYVTKEEVNAALSGAIRREIVNELPDESDADPKVIYFIPASGDQVDSNIKDEYMFINGKWEQIGSTRIDLSGYWSKNELKVMTSEELKAILV